MRSMRSAASGIIFMLMAAESALAAQGDMTTGSLRTFTVLLTTIAALFAVAWFAKKYGPFARMKKDLGLDILGQMPVGNKAHITLVRAGKSILLLGVTQNQVSLIKDLEEGDFEKAFGEIESRGGER